VTPKALVLAVIVLAMAACGTAPVDPGPRVVQPGAPGQPSRDVTGAAPARRRDYTEADVRFMQGMIHHHAQALDMTALLVTRTERDDMKLFARRIEVSQTDEIRTMQQWLRDRGADAPGVHAHHEPGAPLMPGMLSAEQLTRLEAARGPTFDRLFLELMIQHHLGALTMVRELFASAGAGQQSDVFAFASDVEADQSMEIERMGAMLAAIR